MKEPPLRLRLKFFMAKVFQGLLMVKADHADTQDKILRLWCHEESRVFRDRLISAEDRTWFNDALQVISFGRENSVVSNFAVGIIAWPTKPSPLF